ncbi:MAG: acyl-CoA thioesterase [bacterium]
MKTYESEVPAKPVSASKAEMNEVVLPNDANNFGTLLGGKVMHLIDIAGAIAARRHSGHLVVTAAVDSLAFLSSIKVGDIIVLKASVNRTFRTSMEVGVKVWAENTRTGEQKHTASAYLTYVAMDDQGKPTPISSVIPETAEEKRRYDEAALRRGIRLTSCAPEVNR